LPKEQTATEHRMMESWRARACAASLCVGAQIFLFGTGVVMPVSLNGTWIAALLSLPFSAAVTAVCRRKTKACISRAAMLLLALTLLLNAVFAAAALVNFAEQTLLEQASALWIVVATVLAVYLSAISGGEGAAWLCFALRWLLPVLAVVLVLASVPMKVPSGLFPVWGKGKTELGVGALCMLGASSPALMLLLPPPEIVEEEACCLPELKSGFFVRRVLAGAAAGCLLLFCACVCTTYEAISESVEWGARLRIVASDQPHEGIPQTLLVVLQMAAVFLLSVNMLCAAGQAIGCAMKKTGRSRVVPAIFCLLMLGMLLLLIDCGFDIALAIAPLLIVPAGIVLLSRKRRADLP